MSPRPVGRGLYTLGGYMTEIILTLAGCGVGVAVAIIQGFAIVAGLLAVALVGSRIIYWLFEWAMGKD